MRSTDRVHSPAPEELMEYVDGEGSADTRATIEAHLAVCTACRTIVADQRRLTETLQTWRIPPAPASFQPQAPRTTRSRWYPSRMLAAGLATAAVLLGVIAVNQRPRSVSPPQRTLQARGVQAAVPEASPPTLAGPLAGRPPRVAGNVDQLTFRQQEQTSAGAAADRAMPQAAVRVPSVIRTARLQIVANDFSAARAAVDSIVTNAAGFIDHVTVTGDASRARVLRGTLRVPSDRLADALARLRALGQVTEDTQSTQDVTDHIVDLDARLASARATERRLTELLRTRTGRLSDVLEVERELTRVRLDIERLDAEQANVTRRVSYATIEIALSEARKENIDGALSLATRLRVAALDGLESALGSVTAVVLFALRAGPALALWGTLLAATWLVVRRSWSKPRTDERGQTRV